MNENNCNWMKMTVYEWRQLLLNKDDFYAYTVSTNEMSNIQVFYRGDN